jgi:hypothetical protein
MSGLGALVKAGKAARKAEPFYSAVDEAAQALTRGKGTGKEFMIEVLKKPGVKPTEIKERGLQKIEAMPKMTKEEFLAELEKNPAPQIKETVLKDQGEKFSELEKIAERDYGEPFEDLHPDIQDEIEKEFDAAAAQYGEYKLGGGENYREILMKMPAMSDKDTERLMALEAKYRRMSQPSQWVFEDSPEGKEMKALKDKSQQSAYYSSHWGPDEPNVLAHLRVQDRTGPNGEKVLHVEEIQSDWHQAGRKKGYRSQDAINAYAEYEKALPERTLNKITEMFIESGTEPERARELAEKQLKTVLSMSRERNLGPSNMAAILGEEKQMNKLWDAARAEKDKVPDAPFKKNWHELAMKRVLNYAAENGYDRVAITPGAEQANRYSLAKHLNEVHFDPATGHLAGRDHQGKLVVAKQGITPENLEEYIGKEGAQKVLAAAPNNEGVLSLKGADLEVGGEGMKGFYDKMLPDYLNTYGKKYGVQVTPFDITVPPKDSMATSGRVGADEYIAGQITWPEFLQKNPDAAAEFVQPLHGFEITPQMRQDITGKGLPLYQQIGIPAGGAAAGAGALEQDEQGFADGGVVKAAVGGEYDTEPDMADGGARIQSTAFKKGGRVHLSQNPDTMLLDLMSRS